MYKPLSGTIAFVIELILCHYQEGRFPAVLNVQRQLRDLKEMLKQKEIKDRYVLYSSVNIQLPRYTQVNNKTTCKESQCIFISKGNGT